MLNTAGRAQRSARNVGDMMKRKNKTVYLALLLLSRMIHPVSKRRSRKLLNSALKRRPENVLDYSSALYNSNDFVEIVSNHISTDVMEDIYGRVAAIEPRLAAHTLVEYSALLNVVTPKVHDEVSLVTAEIIKNAGGAKKIVVFTPWIRNGGSDLVCFNMVEALSEKYDPSEILVILTDADNVEASRLAVSGCTYLGIKNKLSTLHNSQQIQLVDSIIRNIGCESVLNINSKYCWMAYEKYGARLKGFCKLYACLFCPDYGKSALPSGYADYFFRETIPYLNAVYFDNQRYIDELSNKYSAPFNIKEKLLLHPQPVSISVVKRREPRRFTRGQRAKIIWAGRIVAQKNIETLIQIARLMPQHDFYVYGAAENSYKQIINRARNELRNLIFCGEYSGFESIDINKYDVFLYTSLWDGMPNIILEAVASNIPIVSSNVGGVKEVLKFKDSAIVEDPFDVETYVILIDRVLSDYEAAQSLALATRNDMLRRHDRGQFLRVMMTMPNQKDAIINV